MVQTIQFARWFSGFENEGFAIAEGVPVGCLNEVVQADAGLGGEGFEEFVPFAIFAAEADRKDGSHAQGDEVVEDRARAAGLGADVYDVMNGKAGFERDLLLRRIYFEITIEAEITNYGDAEIGVAAGEFVEVRRDQCHE